MHQPTIHVEASSEHPLVDEPTGFEISGCAPDAEVAVVATVDAGGGRLAAAARFRADAAGRVGTATTASLDGTYRGVDPFGLWWSGTPIGTSGVPADAAVEAELHVETDGRTAAARVARHWLAPGATVTPVDDPGIVGFFARPAGSGPFPAAVAFGGSGGGLFGASTWAPLLASHGVATLAIAYFGLPGLPTELARIEIERVERAVAWLLDRTDVRGPVALMGASRGSELALWSASLLDDVGRTVAFAPSGVSWSGLGAHGPIDAPAWTFRGEDLPWHRIGERPALGHAGEPVALRPLFDRALADGRGIEAATIPVELGRGPILLVSGEADAMWPSAPLGEIVERRARGARPVEHRRYPGAGHTAGGPPGVPSATEGVHPVDGWPYDFGGSHDRNAAARADSWPAVVSFLRESALETDQWQPRSPVGTGSLPSSGS